MRKLFSFLAMMVMLVTSAFAQLTTQNYLKFTSDDASVSFNVVGTLTTTPQLQISKDGKTWLDYTLGQSVPLGEAVGNSVYFRAKMRIGRIVAGKPVIVGNTKFSQDDNNYIQFKSTGNVRASGSIMSLMDTTCTRSTVPAKAFCKLFMNCTKLTTAPSLPSTTMNDSCYQCMFYGCTGLSKAPALPATTLADHCYSQMFQGCTGLSQAPELPATTLEPYCYQTMFSGCSSITTAPDLPAPTLTDHCYQRMFAGCNSLTSVTVSFTDWNTAQSSTASWLNNVASVGTFNGPFTLPDKRGASYIPEGWISATPLCFTARQANTTISFNVHGTIDNMPSLVYSKDGGVTWAYYTFGTELTLANTSQRIYFRAKDKNVRFSINNYNYINFQSSGLVDASGNIMSLLDSKCQQQTVPSAAFCSLFKESKVCTSPMLPATEVGGTSYYEMFRGSSLEKLPALPATVINPYSYEYMFAECSGLTSAAGFVLPATTLAKECYQFMFLDCANLADFPPMALPATNLAEYCYCDMFLRCKSLTVAPELPAKNLAPYCYDGMFGECTSLVTRDQLPDLPATNLAKGCYSRMFNGCSNLTQTPILPALNMEEDCYASMFWGCTSLTDASELPAREGKKGSYECMFYGCKKLDRIVLDLREVDELYHTGLRFEYPDGKTHYCGYAMVENSGSGKFYFRPGLMFKEDYSPDWNQSCSKFFRYDASQDSDLPWKDETRPELSFTSTDSLWSVSLRKYGNVSTLPQLQYSLDGFTWEDYTIGEAKTNLPGFYVFFRAKDKNATFSQSSEGYFKFVTTGNVDIDGNVMYLLDSEGEQTSVPDYAFYRLFAGCNTTTTPSLPATTVGNFAYASMFENCTNLYVPQLVTYYHERRTGLEAQLPATKLGYACYDSMFKGCTGMVSAPELPATELAGACYEEMFSGCEKVTGFCTSNYVRWWTNAGILPATKLGAYCYNSMFKDCTSLESSPELPATDLKPYCYDSMFEDCSSLNHVKVGFTKWFNDDEYTYTENWLKGVQKTGTFESPDDCAVPEEYGASTVPLGWVTNMHDYLCITALEDAEVEFEPQSEFSPFPSIQYSGDGVTWNEYFHFYQSAHHGSTIYLAAGHKIYLKADSTNVSFSTSGGYIQFKSNGKVAVSGSVMSLLDEKSYVSSVPDYAFNRLFKSAPITTAPSLRATKVGSVSYAEMFSGCENLTEVPVILADTLGDFCCTQMFKDCSGITSVKLPAKELAQECYEMMFQGCTNLNNVEVGFSDWNTAKSSTSGWLKDVAATGTFTCPSDLNVSKRGPSYVPVGWSIVGGCNPSCDVNGDDIVDIADVNAILTIMFNSEEYVQSADVNLDGVVDIADVNAVLTEMFK